MDKGRRRHGGPERQPSLVWVDILGERGARRGRGPVDWRVLRSWASDGLIHACLGWYAWCLPRIAVVRSVAVAVAAWSGVHPRVAPEEGRGGRQTRWGIAERCHGGALVVEGGRVGGETGKGAGAIIHMPSLYPVGTAVAPRVLALSNRLRGSDGEKPFRAMQ